MAESEKENPSVSIGVSECHDVGFVLRGVIGLHQVMRHRRVMFQIIQFIGNDEIPKPFGNWVVRIDDVDKEIHVFAMTVEERIQHTVVAFAFPKRRRGRMQTEKPTALLNEVQ